MERVIRVSGRLISVSNEDKLLFPADIISKGDLIAYYHAIAPYMVRLIKNRLISLQRFPHGIDQEGFFQKNKSEYFPSWIRSISVEKKNGEMINYMICNHAATLVYLANQACIVLHTWLSKIDRLEYPDRMVFDLDPSGNASFLDVKWVARQLKNSLEQYGLCPFVMLTGSRGVHVVVPIKRRYTFDVVRSCAQYVAHDLVKEYPSKCTLELHKDRRGDAIFIDTLRNSFGATTVAPYSVRALPGAPVATPVVWNDLFLHIHSSQQYSIKTILNHISNSSDPWFNMHAYSRSLEKLITKTV